MQMHIEVEAKTITGGRTASVSDEQAWGFDREMPSHLYLCVGSVYLLSHGILL